MKIILDAMGGDNAPEAVVLGAVDAAKDFNTEIILVGLLSASNRACYDYGTLGSSTGAGCHRLRTACGRKTNR